MSDGPALRITGLNQTFHQGGRELKVLRDLDWILKNAPPGTELQQIRQMRERIQAEQQDQADKE